MKEKKEIRGTIFIIFSNGKKLELIYHWNQNDEIEFQTSLEMFEELDWCIENKKLFSVYKYPEFLKALFLGNDIDCLNASDIIGYEFGDEHEI